MSVSLCLCKHSGLTRWGAINNIFFLFLFFHIFHNGADHHMFKKLARYDGEGNELAVFRLVLFPFLEHRCNMARFHRGSVDQDL